MSSGTVPASRAMLKLSNGSMMPQLGFGTWQVPTDQVEIAVATAVRQGFRHIDCAAAYRNEVGVGKALQTVVSEGIVKREDLFVVSKLLNTDHHPNHVEAACRKSLKELQLDQLDLYLMHWPMAYAHPENGEYTKDSDFWPRNDKGGMAYDNSVSVQDTWCAMEKLVKLGLVKAIGVCNFTSEDIKSLCGSERTTVKPVTNQVEMHPSLPQNGLRAVHEQFGIVATAYCPLGLGVSSNDASGAVFRHPDWIAITDSVNATDAKATGTTYSAASVCLQWNVTLGNAVITKSVTPERIAENAATPTGVLSAETMARIATDFSAKHPRRVFNPTDRWETGPKPVFVEGFDA